MDPMTQVLSLLAINLLLGLGNVGILVYILGKTKE